MIRNQESVWHFKSNCVLIIYTNPPHKWINCSCSFTQFFFWIWIRVPLMDSSLDLLKEGIVEVKGDNGAFYKAFIVDVQDDFNNGQNDGNVAILTFCHLHLFSACLCLLTVSLLFASHASIFILTHLSLVCFFLLKLIFLMLFPFFWSQF